MIDYAMIGVAFCVGFMVWAWRQHNKAEIKRAEELVDPYEEKAGELERLLSKPPEGCDSVLEVVRTEGKLLELDEYLKSVTDAIAEVEGVCSPSVQGALLKLNKGVSPHAYVEGGITLLQRIQGDCHKVSEPIITVLKQMQERPEDFSCELVEATEKIEESDYDMHGRKRDITTTGTTWKLKDEKTSVELYSLYRGEGRYAVAEETPWLTCVEAKLLTDSWRKILQDRREVAREKLKEENLKARKAVAAKYGVVM